jgi:MFS transporter, DHA1 family, inner membrane transport protein
VAGDSLVDRPTSAVGHRQVPVWLSLLALALGGFAIGTTEFATMGVLPDIADSLHVTIPQAGWAISAYALGVVIGAPLVAVLGARATRKRLLLGLMAAFTLGNVFSVLAQSFPVLVVARFASGLPHGAYFGIGAVVAASLVAPDRRARAVASMMMGLTVANIVGVPASTLLGNALGWRSTYVVVVVVGVATVGAIALLVPQVHAAEGASPRTELGALARPQVWLTLLIGAVGFGGMFAVYSYITPTLTEVSGYPLDAVPIVLALFGVGMTLGTYVGGRLADRSIDRTIALGLVAVIAVFLVFTVTAHSIVPAAITVFALAASGSAIIPALQTRLMDVGREGKALAATLNHSAFNIANALGAWLGGLVIAAGYGYTAPAVVGAILAVIGLLVLGVSVAVGGNAPQATDEAEVPVTA